MVRGLSFSKQAIIDYNTLKDNIATNQGVFIIIDKDNKEILRVINSIKDVEKEVDNIKGHYKFGQIHFDMVGFKEIRDKLSFIA